MKIKAAKSLSTQYVLIYRQKTEKLCDHNWKTRESICLSQHWYWIKLNKVMYRKLWTQPEDVKHILVTLSQKMWLSGRSLEPNLHLSELHSTHNYKWEIFLKALALNNMEVPENQTLYMDIWHKDITHSLTSSLSFAAGVNNNNIIWLHSLLSTMKNSDTTVTTKMATTVDETGVTVQGRVSQVTEIKSHEP